MPESSSSALAATPREPSNSRAVRRLRREGFVPGVVYGGGQEPVAFAVHERDLRHTLAHAGAVIDLQLEGSTPSPVVLKDLVRHPVTGVTTHLDLLRVNLNEAIQTQVTIELAGADDAPGVKQGGILEHILREVTVEALPSDIPDALVLDVSALKVGATVALSAIVAPDGVTILGDMDAPVATISASRASRATGGDDEIETETELVGEAEADADAATEGDEPTAGEDAAA
ncbi:50S ribosomal protein L25 [Conexibacter sp. DBS9H8]|uniref:50S ribosomal protein L25 n=1 Tax=Conexibacter sp. DBS9H8 TaxID=2937801 RepID=UPI00200C61D5|nr:50S ribosomal protein L25 [Conexibacter sp. DBS9H8]